MKDWLVYCSVGDRSVIEQWATADRTFDLFLTYYGAEPGRFEDLADRYEVAHGPKFPNLWAWFQRDPDVFRRYGAVLVLDDDLALSAAAIDELFRIREAHDLWIVQPSFSPRGKLSWDVTRHRPRTTLRFTNFVENGAPLFRADKLWPFLEEFDGSLSGWGIDFWYLHTMDARANPGRFAVADTVVTRNPTNREKGGRREIDAERSPEERITGWEAIRDQRGIPEYPPETIGRIDKPWRHQLVASVADLPDTGYWYGVRSFRRARRRAVRHQVYRSLRPARDRVRHRWGPARIGAPTDQSVELDGAGTTTD